MKKHIIRSCKGWSAGLLILCFPLLFLYPEFGLGKELWKTFFSVVFVIVPVLLLYEFIIRKNLRNNYIQQFVLLAMLLIASEIEFYLLPAKITQVLYFGGITESLIFFLFAILAAFVIVKTVWLKKEIVIIQKEI